MWFECRNETRQKLSRIHYSRVKRYLSPLVKGEIRLTRKDLARDRTARIVAFLDHVLRKLFGIRIAFTRQQKRSCIAVLHPTGLRICELRQLVDGVITLPFRGRIASIYGLRPIETRIALRYGAVVEIPGVSLAVGVHHVTEQHVERRHCAL